MRYGLLNGDDHDNGLQMILNPDSNIEYMWRVTTSRKNGWKRKAYW